jgi:chromosome segregation ATPase
MQTLQAQYEAYEAEKAGLNPLNPDDNFRLTVIEQEQAKIREQLADAERLQRQAAEVAEIELPHDYDDLWMVTGANGEIRNLIRQVKEQLFAAHNDELVQLRASHRAQMDAVTAENTALNERVQKLEGELEVTKNQLEAAQIAAANAVDRLRDAETKRDNSVRLKEEAEAERDRAQAEAASLKRQIDELEGMMRTYRSQSSGGYTGGLKLTSTISAESKEDELNRILARRGLGPLQPPKRPEEPVTEEDVARQMQVVEEAAADAERFPEVVSDDATGAEAAPGAEEVAGDAGEAQPPTLEARVTVLEEWRLEISRKLRDLGYAI